MGVCRWCEYVKFFSKNIKKESILNQHIYINKLTLNTDKNEKAQL